MISTQSILGMLNGPLIQFINFIISAQYAKISFMRMNEIRELENEEEDTVRENGVIPQARDITVSNLFFRYNQNTPYVLQRIHLLIPQNKITAFVGDSGSGKSTLLKLVLRLYRPSHGEIKMGGMNNSIVCTVT